MIKLLIITGLFLNRYSDSLKKESYTDSCTRVFINNIVTNYDYSYVVVNIDSCGRKWEEVVPTVIFYNYYVRTMKMNFKGYVGVVTDQLMTGAGPYNRCGDSLIIGSKLSIQKIKKLQKLPTSTVLKKYFDKNHFVKNEYIDWYYELIYYCYKHLIRVNYNWSQPPYYQ